MIFGGRGRVHRTVQLLERKFRFSGLVLMGLDWLGVSFDGLEWVLVYRISFKLLAYGKNVFQ